MFNKPFISTYHVGGAVQGGRGQGKSRGGGEKVFLFRGKGSLQLSPEVMLIQKRLLFMSHRDRGKYQVCLSFSWGQRVEVLAIKIVTITTTKIVTS